MGFTEDDRETLGVIKQTLVDYGEDIKTNKENISVLQRWQNNANGALKLIMSVAVLATAGAWIVSMVA